MELESFVLSGLILLLVTSLMVTLFKQIGLGAVLGLLVAGIIVGPYTPGPLVTTQVEALRHFTEFGVVLLLLFLVGLEMRPARLWQLRREVFGLGSLQILLSGVALASFFALFQREWQTALLIGLTLALSSTAFVMQILRDNGEIASSHGRVTFSVLLMQDLAIVPLLAVLPLLASSGHAPDMLPPLERLAAILGSLAVIGVCGAWLVPRALDRLARHDNREAFLLVTMLAVFFAAWATGYAGLSMALGAFLMGMLLAKSRYNLQIQAYVEPYKGLLISIFFVAVGMSIDVGMILRQPVVFLGSALVVIGIKIVVMLVLGRLFGLDRGVLVRVAFLLAQGGEFGFVLLGSARALGVIDATVFAFAIGIISLSMLATPLLARLGNALADRLAPGAVTAGSELRGDPHGPQPRVIIGGYGRVGHIVATLLHASGVPFLVLETDPVCVAKGKADGYPVYFGDVSDVDLLAAAGAERVALVVLTVDRVDTALRAVTHLRTLYPQVPVISRARDLQASAALMEAGATMAYPEVVESSLRLAASALEMLAIPVDDVDALLRGIRGDRYTLVRDPEGDSRAPG